MYLRVDYYKFQKKWNKFRINECVILRVIYIWYLCKKNADIEKYLRFFYSLLHHEAHLIEVIQSRNRLHLDAERSNELRIRLELVQRNVKFIENDNVALLKQGVNLREGV